MTSSTFKDSPLGVQYHSRDVDGSEQHAPSCPDYLKKNIDNLLPDKKDKLAH